MDWNRIKGNVKKQLGKNGISVSVVTEITGSYNVTADTVTSTIATYDDIKVVLKNPTMQDDSGVFGKSDRLQMLIPSSGLPTLDEISYKVISGTTIWFPSKTISIKPGGIPVLYIADLR